jgi:hypothetical protein
LKCASSADRHLIASGSSGGQFDICLWTTPVNQGSESAKAHGRKRPDLFVIVNGIILLFMLWVMSDLWKPFLSEVSRRVTFNIKPPDNKSGCQVNDYLHMGAN